MPAGRLLRSARNDGPDKTNATAVCRGIFICEEYGSISALFVEGVMNSIG